MIIEKRLGFVYTFLINIPAFVPETCFLIPTVLFAEKNISLNDVISFNNFDALFIKLNVNYNYKDI